MAKYVLLRIVTVKALQVITLVASVLSVWYIATVILHLILGDIMPVEHSQIVAFILLTFAAAIVQIYLWLKSIVSRINDRMHRWALRRQSSSL